MKNVIILMLAFLFTLYHSATFARQPTTASYSAMLFQFVHNGDTVKIEEVLQKCQMSAQHHCIDVVNQRGETPLLVATQQNQVAIARLLIDKGADINKQDNIADSPYLYAAAQGKTEILRYMIEHGQPDQQVFNRYGGNAIIPAAEKGHLENVRILLQDGKVDINHQNHFGYTALIEVMALTDGSEIYQQIARELIKYKADKSLRDNSGRTAMDYAKARGFRKMMAILAEN